MRRIGFTAAFLALLLVGVITSISTTFAQSGPAVSVAVDLDANSAKDISPEGLVSDKDGRLYTSDTNSLRLFRYTPSTNGLEMLGMLPRSATGMAFDTAGNLYFASSNVVLRINADVLAGSTITATDVVTFATGVTGANGLAFDATGKLYVSGGATGNIYVVASDGITSTWKSGFISNRTDQTISTNGLAFGNDGSLYSSNTGSGMIDRITVNSDGTAGNVEHWVTDALLLGADGITFAANGDLYVAANERNAIVRVTPDGTVSDVTSNDNTGPLEFPASPSFSGDALYVNNFDIARGANAPNTPGIGAAIMRIAVGVAGKPLPVTAAVVATPSAVATAAATATSVAAPTEAATVAPVPTAVPIIATPMPVEPTATVTAPGMPVTGGGSGSWPVGAILAVCGLAILSGFGIRYSASRANNR